MRKLLIVMIALFLVVATGLWQRHRLLFSVLGTGEPPPLLPASDEGPLVRWHDDYFTIQALDAQTFAIGEPRYEQQNYSYLIVGSDRAVLFDAGPGFRDIRAVAESLTDQPITFVPSHFHYDHIGNTVTFDRVAVVDLPYLRERAVDNRLPLRWAEHLGTAEGVAAPVLEVDEWLAPGSVMSLGDRLLRVLYTPGHTEDSISLLDMASGVLFSGDYIYPGALYAFLPNSGMGDYVQGADTLLESVPAEVRIYGAHRVKAPGAPELSLGDLQDLQSALSAIRAGTLAGSGLYPREYPVNDRMALLAEPRWLQNWTPRHP